MASKTTYHEEERYKNAEKLKELQQELPEFTKEFFRSIANTRSERTMVAYAYDLKVFFNYITKHHTSLSEKPISGLVISDLLLITPDDLDLYLEFLSNYLKENLSDNTFKKYKNDASGKQRKLAAVRAMYQHFYKKRKIESNPASLISTPRVHEKAIIRLENNEMKRLLDEVETGSNLTDREKKYHTLTASRDMALITLLLGTGMRVSECVGIDLTDVDFELNGVKIVRKGGNESIIYFPDEVREVLEIYLKERIHKTPSPGSENALFLSLQNKRINVRTVEKLVKKYSTIAAPLKKISPHKLRSTYGTNLYRATGDIYLVADVLGHKDVNTTRKHYADMSEENRKRAAQFVKIRK